MRDKFKVLVTEYNGGKFYYDILMPDNKTVMCLSSHSKEDAEVIVNNLNESITQIETYDDKIRYLPYLIRSLSVYEPSGKYNEE